MNEPARIEIRPAVRRDSTRLEEFLATAPPTAGAAESADSLFLTDVRSRVIALSDGTVVGTCPYIGGSGRCAVIPPPRMFQWDPALAVRLYRAAAAHALRRHGARLIQALTDPAGATPIADALRGAGFEVLAMLSYMRRSGQPEDLHREPRADFEWQHYSLLRHRRFAETILRTYEQSLDCPRLAGLRDIDDTIATHKHTGTFSPRTWRLVLSGGKPAGVCLVNNLQGRGDLVYLGVAPETRGRGIARALLERALRDTAEMGLPAMGLAVDVANTPAVRLYESMGFKEIRRRLAHFIPGETLAALAAE